MHNGADFALCLIIVSNIFDVGWAGFGNSSYTIATEPLDGPSGFPTKTDIK